jgi:ubiquitin-protein ligase
MTNNPRSARLAIEYTKLMNLVSRSKFIKIEPVDVQPGWPPEKYKVTYTCNGIAGVDEHEAPISTNFHQVMIYMGRDYPAQEPQLKWLTPIWHPNIQHEEPFKVCTNNVQNWYPTKSLVDLVVAMGEMVQYKRYHAKWVHPYPLDQMAADWVIRYAEPGGIVGADKPYDRRPLLRKRGIHHYTQRKLEDEGGRIVFGGLKKGADKAQDVPVVQAAMGPVLRPAAEAEPEAPAAAPAPAAGATAPPASAAPPEPSRPARSGISFGIKRAATGELPPLAPQATDQPAASAPAHTFEVFRGGDEPRVVAINKPVFSIGRGDNGVEVDMTLDADPTAGGVYAVLERDETGSFWLTAKGDAPVRVNGRLLPRERSIGLDVSDQIEISSFSIRFQ